eukprot:maker-scaffold738_size104417-snap-gene-0.15 protein:Tk11629 transcript:maker-scaffold738_size104417-snap-gene-0.15-mRNA-1 annotation:"low quality protein: apoptosis 2 inhibitor-like"
MESWDKRLTKCIELQGDYVEKYRQGEDGTSLTETDAATFVTSAREPQFSSSSYGNYSYDPFYGWPKHMSQSAESMIEAGFSYLGRSDHVRCSHCLIGLKHWDPKDEPWVEHARWSPKCPFVLEKQGPEFIEQCLREFPPLEEDETEVNTVIPPSIPTSEADPRSIEEIARENERLKRQKLCPMCSNHEVNMVGVPCGHFISCSECKEKVTHCPRCDIAILEKIHAFLAYLFWVNGDRQMGQLWILGRQSEQMR